MKSQFLDNYHRFFLKQGLIFENNDSNVKSMIKSAFKKLTTWSGQAVRSTAKAVLEMLPTKYQQIVKQNIKDFEKAKDESDEAANELLKDKLRKQGYDLDQFDQIISQSVIVIVLCIILAAVIALVPIAFVYAKREFWPNEEQKQSKAREALIKRLAKMFNEWERIG